MHLRVHFFFAVVDINEKWEVDMGEDYLKGTEIFIKQEGYHFGTDAILLTDFANNYEDAIDLGCGNGALILRLMGLRKINRGIGIEIDESQARLALENIRLNNLTECIKIINGDYMDIEELLPKGKAQMVISNPPYFKNSLMGREKSFRHEINMTFEGLVRASGYLLKDGGVFLFSHTPSRLSEIFKVLNTYNLEPKRICVAEPKGKSASIILIEARKNAKEGLIMEKTIIL